MYQHKPLTPGRNIRVLSLQPATELDAPVNCSLKEISLDDVAAKKESYSALSYVWGSPTGDQPITCDGETLLVTPNCLSALQHLRRPSRSRILWIDAICIDQNSIDEKNHQVGLMGAVYRLANHVFIWIGAGDPAILTQVRKFNSLKLRLYNQLMTRQNKLITRKLLLPPRKWIKAHVPLKRPFNRDQESALVKLVDNEWFHRVWTFQELCLAKRPLVVYGTTKVHWDEICNSITYYYNYKYSKTLLSHLGYFMTAQRFRVILDLYNIQRRGFYTPIPRLNLMRNGQRHPGAEILVTSSPISQIIIEALDAFRHRLSANPLDKIYGLYHVFADLGVALSPPDYRVRPADLYEEVTFLIIRALRSLMILDWCVSEQRSDDLPSWVPDFKHTPRSLPISKLTFEGGHMPPQVHLKEQRGELTLPCQFIGKVEVVSGRMILTPLPPINQQTPFRRWDQFRRAENTLVVFRRWCGTFDDSAGQESPRNDEGFFTTLARPEMLVWSSSEAQRRVELFSNMKATIQSPELRAYYGTFEEGNELFKKLLQSWDNVAQMVDNVAQLADEVAKIVDDVLGTDLEGMVLFKTSDELWGLSTGDVRIGDSISLCPGTRLPMIVRDSSKQAGTHVLVGLASMAMIPQELRDRVDELEGVVNITLV